MENTQNEKEEKTNWFSDVSLKNIVLYIVLSTVVGGGAGAGVVATKAVAQTQVPSMTQEQGDLRYMSKEEAAKRIEYRNEEIKSLRKEMLTRELYEAYHQTDAAKIDRIESSLNQLLEGQNRYK